MNNTLRYVIGVVAGVVISVGLLFLFSDRGSVGGSTNFGGDLVVDALTVNSTATLLSDTAMQGGTLTVTTANTATSTLIVGCIQFYATSTATALRYQASTTPGVMVSQYGSCPNL